MNRGLPPAPRIAHNPGLEGQAFSKPKMTMSILLGAGPTGAPLVLVFPQWPCPWPPRTCLFSAPRPSLRPVCSDLCLACPVQAGLKQPLAYLTSRPVPSSALPPCWKKPQPPLTRPSANSSCLLFTGPSCSSVGLSFSACQIGYKSLGSPGAQALPLLQTTAIYRVGRHVHVCTYMHACKTPSCVTVYIYYLL